MKEKLFFFWKKVKFFQLINYTAVKTEALSRSENNTAKSYMNPNICKFGHIRTFGD